MVKAVIFDMDGVLVDSQPFHFTVDQAVLSKCGFAVPLAVVQRYAGMSNPNRWAKYKQDFRLAPPVEELIATHVATIMEQLEQADLQAIPCVPALLSSLRAKGLKLSVASSSSYDFIYKMLDKIGIRGAFDLVVSGEDMANSKPAPDIFLHSAKMLGCDVNECVVVEDSASGVQAAVAAGIRCVGYRNLNSGVQNLSGAALVVDDFQALLGDEAWLVREAEMETLVVFDRKNYNELSSRTVRESARAVVFKGDKIALVYIRKHDMYGFPGGSVEAGESLTEAVIRETCEETGLIVKPQSVKPLYAVAEIRKDLWNENIFEQRDCFFLCEVEAEMAMPKLSPEEASSGYQLVFATLEEAIATNEREISEGAGFSERETYVLKRLRDGRRD